MFFFSYGSVGSNCRRDIDFKVHEGEEFETTRWPYFVALPLFFIATLEAAIKKGICSLLWGSTPDVNSWLVDRNETKSQYVGDHSATWRVLDFLYNHESSQDYTSLSDWFHAPWSTLDEFWVSNRNAQAVRNRFIITKRLLRKEIERAAENKDVIKILSLASGSAEALIQVVAEMNQRLDTTVQAHLVDVKRGALEKAEELACKHGVRDKITVEQTTVGSSLDGISGSKFLERRHSAPRREKLLILDSVQWSVSDLGKYEPDICEMIGFLDYLPDQKARKYMKQIRVIMDDEGSFLTCNIFRNLEMYFLMLVVNWYMLYRSKGGLAELPLKSGFQASDVHIEPQCIHGIVVAQKS